MQYTVPQFIDREDKIVGPITVRQFLLMMVAAIFIAIAYAILRFMYFLVAAVVIVVLTGVVAFIKVNGRPFHFFLISVIERVKRPHIRVWNKELTDSELRHYIKKKEEEKPEERYERPRLTTSHLSQLSLVVDSGGSYGGEDIFQFVEQKPPEEDKKGKKKNKV